MRAYIAPWVLVSLLLISGSGYSEPSRELRPADEWNEPEKDLLPMLILFSTKDCFYCERLKTEVLSPLVERGELGNFVGYRELNISRGGKIRDFDGEKIRTRAFVKRYGIYATPTLLLVDDRGNPIGTPIVGYNNSGEYLPNLRKLIEAAGADRQLAGTRAEPEESPGSS